MRIANEKLVDKRGAYCPPCFGVFSVKEASGSMVACGTRIVQTGSEGAAYFFFSDFTGLQSFFFLSAVARHFLHAYFPGTSHSFGLSSRQPKTLSPKIKPRFG
jgi:hypothetical protein